MSYVLESSDDNDSDGWEIVFWTRGGQCASIQLQALLSRLADDAVARLLLTIQEFARPPRDTQHLCCVVGEVIEVYAMPVEGRSHAFVLLAAHCSADKIYVLGVEDLEGQGH